MLGRPLSLRSRRRLRNLGVAALVGVGVAVALAGAVVLLALLAVGAVAHIVWSALRPRVSAPPNPAAGRVIEGEFIVVGGPPRSGERRVSDASAG